MRVPRSLRLLLGTTASMLPAGSPSVILGRSVLLAILAVPILNDLLMHLRHLRIIKQVLQRQKLLITEIAIEVFLNFVE